jgi:hypothetical protein
LLLDFKQQLDRATIGCSGDTFPRARFDVQKARELLDQIEEAQQNMTDAINEANLHADACKKSKLQSFEK